SSIAIADFNSDNKLDLAITNSGNATLAIFLGNGDGTFQAVKTYQVGVNPVAVVPADYDRDQILDGSVLKPPTAEHATPQKKRRRELPGSEEVQCGERHQARQHGSGRFSRNRQGGSGGGRPGRKRSAGDARPRRWNIHSPSFLPDRKYAERRDDCRR